MFHSSHLIFVKQRFLLTSFGSWFWCYFGSFRFLCLQLVTLQVVSGSYLLILFKTDTEFPRKHNISLFFAKKNIQITVDRCVRNRECMLMREDIIQNLWNKHILILPMYCKNYQTQNLMEQVTYQAMQENTLQHLPFSRKFLQKLQRKINERCGVQYTYSITSYYVRRLSPT